MGIEWNDVSAGSSGGTELMARRLESSIDPDLLSNFQIVPSRLRGSSELDPARLRVLWLHDLPGDPESDKLLTNEGWRRFHRIVCVSNWQLQAYVARYRIPWSKCAVIQNAIEPIAFERKTEGPVSIVYTSTPHRGLEILVAAYEKLRETRDVTLDVFSSFSLYGWDDRDEHFRPVFEKLESLPGATWHRSQPNAVVRDFLRDRAEIFAYPSVWQETSCLCLMEAMSAGLTCVHPNLGALYETAANMTSMYQFQEDPSRHASVLYSILDHHIGTVRTDESAARALGVKSYADAFYDWNERSKQWTVFLRSLLDEPRNMPTEDFVYRIG